MSENATAKTNVLFYEKDKPGMGRGAAGQLIVTDRRLVYVKYLWKHMRAVVKDYADNIDDGLKNEGSLEIPGKQIIEAKAERTLGTPFLRVRYKTSAGEKACSFVFTTSLWMVAGGVDVRKGHVESLANAIEQLKRES